VVRAAFGGWSVDSFILARSAPPVDTVGAIYFAAGTALYPRPNVNLGAPLEPFGSQYPGGKIFNKAAFSVSPKGSAREHRPQCPAGFRSYASRCCRPASVSSHREHEPAFPFGVLQHFQPAEFRQSRQQLNHRCSVTPRKSWRAALVPAALMAASTPLPNRRPPLNLARPQLSF
jgi:hypothetical protein